MPRSQQPSYWSYCFCPVAIGSLAGGLQSATQPAVTLHFAKLALEEEPDEDPDPEDVLDPPLPDEELDPDDELEAPLPEEDPDEEPEDPVPLFVREALSADESVSALDPASWEPASYRLAQAPRAPDHAKTKAPMARDRAIIIPPQEREDRRVAASLRLGSGEIQV
jgi:hypothetical protein